MLWAGIGKGTVEARPEALEHGEIVVFEAGADAVAFTAHGCPNS